MRRVLRVLGWPVAWLVRRWKRKIRVVYLGPVGYVRFFPNVGFTLFGFHWCRHYRRRVH